jgi:PKD repeat protein
MTQLSLKYMTAWLNFHLQGKPQYFSYLYGDHADDDINAGLIIRQVETFPGTAPDTVEIGGPIAGLPETIYQFSASIEPITTTLPITVIWSATHQDMITRTVELLTDQVEMSWSDTGSKTITATVMNSSGQAINTHEIHIFEAAQADFEASPVSGVAPLHVTFTNTSVGDHSSNDWAFGDGYTSNLENPTHIYNETGSYTVTLTIDGSDGMDQEIKAGYINVYAYQVCLPFAVR